MFMRIVKNRFTDFVGFFADFLLLLVLEDGGYEYVLIFPGGLI